MRFLLIGDAPWLPTEDGRQLGELAQRLRDDLHTVFFMPTKGMGTNVGGAFSKDGIEYLPTDADNGNDIVKWHVQHTGADLVISRGDASRFDQFRGSEFRWVSWFPGRKATNTVLRHTRSIIVPTQHEIDVMHHDALKDTDNLSGRWMHYCPTGFLYCWKCFATGTEPEPYSCTRWMEYD